MFNFKIEDEMKKTYIIPQTETVVLKTNAPLLIVSQSDPSSPKVSIDGDYTSGDID